MCASADVARREQLEGAGQQTRELLDEFELVSAVACADPRDAWRGLSGGVVRSPSIEHVSVPVALTRTLRGVG
eukprot:11190588-Lingulodinium_polyedra.AAC.1